MFCPGFQGNPCMLSSPLPHYQEWASPLQYELQTLAQFLVLRVIPW